LISWRELPKLLALAYGLTPTLRRPGIGGEGKEDLKARTGGPSGRTEVPRNSRIISVSFLPKFHTVILYST